MMYQNLLVTGTLSALLLTTSGLLAQEDCPTCYVDLKNLKPKIEVQHKSEFKTHYSKTNSNSYEIIEEGEVTVVFPSYVMTDEEKANYYREQKAIALNKKANEEANRELKVALQPVEKIEDKILNKDLPTSDYFCDNDKKPVRIKNSNRYECVS